MLMVFAAPAASVPPPTVASISHGEGHPFFASSMVGTVVTTSKAMMRGLVSATYALMVRRSCGSSAPARLTSAAAAYARVRLVTVTAATRQDQINVDSTTCATTGAAASLVNTCNP